MTITKYENYFKTRLEALEAGLKMLKPNINEFPAGSAWWHTIGQIDVFKELLALYPKGAMPPNLPLKVCVKCGETTILNSPPCECPKASVQEPTMENKI